MVALTSVGNTFNIRHHETGKYPITVEAYDYLFARMSNVIIVLLRQSDRQHWTRHSESRRGM